MINRIEEFVQFAAKQKVWVFTAGLFFACLTFIYNFALAYPSKSAAFEKGALELNVMLEEQARLDKTFGLLEGAFKTFATNMGTYLKVRTMLIEEQRFDRTLLNAAISQNAEGIRSTGLAISTLQGMRFEQDRYASFAKDSIDELTGCTQILAAIKNLYSSTLAESVEEIKKNGDELKALLAKQPGYGSLERIEGIMAKFRQRYSEIRIRLDEERGNYRVFQVQKYLAALAGLYMGVFVIFAVRSWIRRLKMQSLVNTNQRLKSQQKKGTR